MSTSHAKKLLLENYRYFHEDSISGYTNSRNQTSQRAEIHENVNFIFKSQATFNEDQTPNPQTQEVATNRDGPNLAISDIRLVIESNKIQSESNKMLIESNKMLIESIKDKDKKIEEQHEIVNYFKDGLHEASNELADMIIGMVSSIINLEC